MRTRKAIAEEAIVAALQAHAGDVDAAAAALGVSGRTLYRRMKEYGIRAQVEYRKEAA